MKRTCRCLIHFLPLIGLLSGCCYDYRQKESVLNLSIPIPYRYDSTGADTASFGPADLESFRTIAIPRGYVGNVDSILNSPDTTWKNRALIARSNLVLRSEEGILYIAGAVNYSSLGQGTLGPNVWNIYGPHSDCPALGDGMVMMDTCYRFLFRNRNAHKIDTVSNVSVRLKRVPPEGKCGKDTYELEGYTYRLNGRVYRSGEPDPAPLPKR